MVARAKMASGKTQARMGHEIRPLDPCNFFRARTNAPKNDETMDRNKTMSYSKVSRLQSAKFVEKTTRKAFWPIKLPHFKWLIQLRSVCLIDSLHSCANFSFCPSLKCYLIILFIERNAFGDHLLKALSFYWKIFVLLLCFWVGFVAHYAPECIW